MRFGDDLMNESMSDGSTDSFFDDPIAKLRKNTIKTEANNSNKNTPRADVKEIEKQETTGRSKDDWLGLVSNDSNKEDDKIQLNTSKKQIKKISFEDDDILGTLGLNKSTAEKPKGDLSDITQVSSNKERKNDLLGSILKLPKKEESISNIFSKDTIISGAVPPPDVSIIKDSTQDSGRNLPSREGRRRKVTSGLVDPLGLLSSETKNEDSDAFQLVDESSKNPARANSLSSADVKDVETLASSKRVAVGKSKSVPNLLESQTSGLPDWLNGSARPKSSAETDRSEAKALKMNEINQEETLEVPATDRQHPLDSFLTQQKMNQSQMEYQNTSMSLHQQESQILMALQMKKYEENLRDIQRHQQEILLKQEQQFNALLERQISKQCAMENNMRLQQERINNHIQLLLSQPRIDTPVQRLEEEMEKTKKIANEEQMKIHEEMITSLKQRQHEELFILEEYYKKQISVLEQTTQNTENRLKTELEMALTKTDENSKLLKEEFQREIVNYQKKIEEMEEEHAKDIKRIRDNYARVIEEIKYEQNVLIETIRESKKAESSVVSNAEEFREKLDGNIQLLQQNSQFLRKVSGRIDDDFGVLHSAKEESLKAKEKEIDMMRAVLEKCRESAETERSQLMGLVRTLESKIAEQSQEAREERWALQQAVSTFAARAAAFDRETEFTKASLERERDQLKTLKENLLAEQERTMLQLTEEKLAISAEKSRLEVSNKLGFQYDSQKAKAELEAALNVAKEATEMTDRERENLQRQIVEIESEKRSLQDRSRKLASKEMELARLSNIADKKSQDGEKALEEAKLIEMRCNDRMKQLQQRLSQLSIREKRITEEKIALSKERIALNTQMKKANICSLCANEEPQNDVQNKKSGHWNGDVIEIGDMPHFPRFEVADEEIFRFQLADKEERIAT